MDTHPAIPSLEDVIAFNQSFKVALFDVFLERNRKSSLLYFDADVVIGMILGLHDHTPAAKAPHRAVVRSLAATGFLGRISVLLPHALEIEQYIHLSPDPEWEEKGEHVAAAMRFAERGGALQVLRDLLEIIQMSDEDDIPRDDEFVQCLSGLGLLGFSVIERCIGTTRKRLRMLLDYHLDLRSAGPPIEQSTADSQTWRYFEHLSAKRHDRHAGLNNLRDAVALNTLAGMATESRMNESAPLVRFYTETPLLVDLISSAEYLDIFSVPSPSVAPGLALDRNTILRDERYFIIRSIFPELSMRDRRARPKALARLVETQRQIGTIVDQQDAFWALEVSRISVSGRPLTEVITEVENLRAARYVWQTTDFGEVGADIFPQWRKVWNHGRTEDIARLLSDGIEHAENEIERSVRAARIWQKHLLEVMESATSLRTRASSVPLNPKPLVHLGMIRWGFDLSVDEEGRISSLYRELVSSSDEALIVVCKTLLENAYSARSSRSNAIVAVAVLWCLELYSCILRVIESLVEGIGQTTAIANIRDAARLRCDSVKGAEEVESIVDRIARERQSTDTAVRFGLGYGYVLYCGFRWYQDIARRAGGSVESSVAWKRSIEVARLSIESVDSVLRATEPPSMEWAFAVNHKLYVASALGDSDHTVERLIRDLESLRATKVWHYRFADTLAYRSYREASNMLEVGVIDEAARRAACSHLSYAADLLSEAVPDFGDSEVVRHKRSVRRWWNLELKCEGKCPLDPM